jgi:renalase
MAGATAARHLAGAGLDVRIFDKGRQAGGRMANRRVGARHFDHGAQFMRAHGAAFAARIADWERRGIVAPWAGSGRRVGVPDMTAPVKDLLTGLPVAGATTVSRIYREGPDWHLADASGAEHGPFDALAVTFPAPQTVALLAASGFTLSGVEDATYAPCWSLMVAAASASSRALVEPQQGPIALIACDASKPGRAPGSRLIVHATPSWSRANLEAPLAAVEAELVRAAAEALGIALQPTYAAAHRWRYAQVEEALNVSSLYDPTLRLGAAGDWCLGARIEAAHDSGLSLARSIVADLGVTP